MIKHFAISGNRNYAKSARLYLQLMHDTPKSHPRLFDCLIKLAYQVIRRSEEVVGRILGK